VNRSVVIVALLGFVIAAQIDPDEPSAVASCNDLANFASHRVSSLARKEKRTPSAHSMHGEASIHELIGRKLDDRPQVREAKRCCSDMPTIWHNIRTQACT
jgi:hypothetical protein